MIAIQTAETAVRGSYPASHPAKDASLILKGQSNEIFDLQFFSSIEPAWYTDQWFKIFSILVKFSPSYSNFYESPRGMILRRVNLPGVSYPGESNYFSRSYLKGQSNKIFYLFFS